MYSNYKKKKGFLIFPMYSPDTQVTLVETLQEKVDARPDYILIPGLQLCPRQQFVNNMKNDNSKKKWLTVYHTAGFLFV